MRLVQLQHTDCRRTVAIVEEPVLRCLRSAPTAYDLARQAIAAGQSLNDAAGADAGDDCLEYEAVYSGDSDWMLLPCFDHPQEQARCFVSGTGLTHQASAANRNAMHESDTPVEMTDSMQVFQWGIEGGNPAPGNIGVQPEWFYKGTGVSLAGHGTPLKVPDFADDGGEEPEIAGLYLNDETGTPRRVGMCIGNEFSDHVMEKKNYLYLAPCKLRMCAIGPELVTAPDFANVTGHVSIERGESRIWGRDVISGEENMCHSIANLEYHHFKYPGHRQPGDVHVHFFGADAFSFGDGVALEDGDIMEVAWNGFGRPLRNPIRIDSEPPKMLKIEPL